MLQRLLDREDETAWSAVVGGVDLARPVRLGDGDVEVAGDRHHLRLAVHEPQQEHRVRTLPATVLEPGRVETGIDEVLAVARVRSDDEVVRAVAPGAEDVLHRDLLDPVEDGAGVEVAAERDEEQGDREQHRGDLEEASQLRSAAGTARRALRRRRGRRDGAVLWRRGSRARTGSRARRCDWPGRWSSRGCRGGGEHGRARSRGRRGRGARRDLGRGGRVGGRDVDLAGVAPRTWCRSLETTLRGAARRVARWWRTRSPTFYVRAAPVIPRGRRGSRGPPPRRAPARGGAASVGRR